MKTIYKPEYETLLRILRDERERKQITQEKLSADLGMHKTYVNKYESGSKRLDILELLQITDKLGTDIYELIRAVRCDTKEDMMEEEPFIHGFARGYLLGAGHGLPEGITTKIAGKYKKK